MNRLILNGLLAAVSLVWAGLTPAGAAVVSFAGTNSTPGGGYTVLGNSWNEQGFTITSASSNLAAWNTGGVGYQSSPGAFSDTSGGSITLSRNNHELFSLDSIDLSLISPNSSGTSVTFHGVKADNSTVDQTFNVSGFGYQTDTFSNGFDNLVSVYWTQGNDQQHYTDHGYWYSYWVWDGYDYWSGQYYGHYEYRWQPVWQVDPQWSYGTGTEFGNIHLTPDQAPSTTPEPGGMAILFSGAGTAIGVMWRRKR